MSIKNGRHSLVVYVEQVCAADSQNVLDCTRALVDGHDGEMTADRPFGFGPYVHGQSLDHDPGRACLGLQILGRSQARGPHGGRRRAATGQYRDGGQSRDGPHNNYCYCTTAILYALCIPSIAAMKTNVRGLPERGDLHLCPARIKYYFIIIALFLLSCLLRV